MMKLRKAFLTLCLCASLLGAFSASITQAAAPDIHVMYDRLTAQFPFHDDGGMCAYKANVWAYELQRMTELPIHKALLLYSNDFMQKEWFRAREWRFHIVPVVQVNQKWVVFEKANGITEPLTLSKWMKQLNHGIKCDILESVPESVRSAYASYEYGKKFLKENLSGNCVAFIVDVNVSNAGDDYLDFSPNSFPVHPLNRDKALWSCLGYDGTKEPSVNQIDYCEKELRRFD